MNVYEWVHLGQLQTLIKNLRMIPFLPHSSTPWWKQIISIQEP